MSQPTESPTRGNWAESLDRLGELSPQGWENLGTIARLQQADFDRLIQNAQKVPLKDRLNDKVQAATGRAHAVYNQTMKRLSESAVATKGRQIGQGALDRGTELTRGAIGLYEEGRDLAKEAGREAKAFGREVKAETKALGRDLKEAGQDLKAETKAFGRDLKEAGQELKAETKALGRDLKEAGRDMARDAKAAGKGLVDKASRWMQTQKTRVTVAAEGARATVAAARFDKNMPGTTPKDLTQLSQQHSRIMAGPTLESRLEAAQAVAQQLQSQVDAKATAQAAHAALGGMAPAGKAVNQGQPTQTQQPTAEQAANTNLQKNADNKGIGGR